MHHLHITTPDESHLPAAAHLSAHGHAALLGHLRWHHRTPYAYARIAQVLVHGEYCGRGIGRALVQHVVALLEAEDAPRIHTQCAPERIGFWQALGFAPQQRFVRYTDGLFLEAQRDEVLLLEPAHTLGLLHLDRKATGEDRAPLILEHRYAAQGYVEQGRLRGGLLPVLGHGLILADAPHVGLELQRWLLPVQPHLIVPEANEAACALLHERNYRIAGTCVRMVRGAAPSFRAELVYAWPW